MSRIRRSSWNAFLLGACTAAALAVASGAVINTVGASSPPGTGDATATRESPGYATPQDAVSAYIAALQRADLGAMTSAFAIESYVARYDFTAYLDAVGTYNPSAPIKLPASDPLNVALNIESRAAQVNSGILYQYLALCCSDLDLAQVEALPDEAAITDFVDDLSARANSDVLTSIDSFTFVPLEELDAYETYTSETNQQVMARREAVLGADEMTDLAVRIPSIDGDVYAFFGLVRYGDEWWVSELGGTFANLLGISVADAGITPVDQIG